MTPTAAPPTPAQAGTPPGPRRDGRAYEIGLMFLLSLAFGCVFFDRNALNYLTPFVAPDLHLSNLQLGEISAGFSCAWAIAGYRGGALSDSTGRRKAVLLVAFVIFSLCSCLSAMATSFGALLAARILMGLAEGPIMPVMQSLVVAASDAGRRGLNMGFVQNFGSNLIGSTVAPLVLVPLAALFGWRGAFYLAAGPGLVLAALMWWYVREPKRVARAAAADDPTNSTAGAPHRPTAAALRLVDALRDRNLRLCILISIFMVPWMILAWVFLPLFFVQERHVSLPDMSILMSILGISAAMFGFVVPGLSDRVGRKPVMVVFTLIGTLTPLAVLYYPGPLPALGALIFTGWAASGVFPLFMGTIPSETVPARHIATAMGLVMGLGELIGGVVTPMVAGWAADTYGRRAPFYIEAACALIAGALALLLRETAPAKLERGSQVELAGGHTL